VNHGTFRSTSVAAEFKGKCLAHQVRTSPAASNEESRSARTRERTWASFISLIQPSPERLGCNRQQWLPHIGLISDEAFDQRPHNAIGPAPWVFSEIDRCWPRTRIGTSCQGKRVLASHVCRHDWPKTLRSGDFVWLGTRQAGRRKAEDTRHSSSSMPTHEPPMPPWQPEPEHASSAQSETLLQSNGAQSRQQRAAVTGRADRARPGSSSSPQSGSHRAAPLCGTWMSSS
jgi:hypothetical protein